MDSYMNMTGNINGNNNTRPFPKSRSNGNFSQALVNKSDIGDFQAGVFVMVEPTPQPQHRPQRPKTHKTPERNLEKRTKSDITYQQHRPSPPHSQPHPSHPHPHSHPHQRARSANDMDSMTREGDLQVSHGRLTTSPTRSPTRNKRNSHSPQQPQPIPQYMDSHTPSSPHKPRKAHEKHADRTESLSHDSGSPKDKGPSPPPSRWAGPAFSNAPPPSSLPIPDFPPFLPSSSPPSSSPPSSSPSTSPSQSVPIPSHYAAPPALYQEPPFFIQPPLYAVPHAYPTYSVHYSYSEFPVHQPSLAQLSTDLRRMLNVNEQPIPA